MTPEINKPHKKKSMYVRMVMDFQSVWKGNSCNFQALRATPCSIIVWVMFILPFPTLFFCQKCIVSSEILLKQLHSRYVHYHGLQGYNHRDPYGEQVC